MIDRPETTQTLRPPTPEVTWQQPLVESKEKSKLVNIQKDTTKKIT